MRVPDCLVCGVLPGMFTLWNCALLCSYASGLRGCQRGGVWAPVAPSLYLSEAGDLCC